MAGVRSAVRLIVNADDYGRTPGVSAGIREAHTGGIVTSTTTMMNMPGVEDDLRLALREAPRLGLGVHLVLTSGQPLSPPDRVPSLVDATGAFPGQEQQFARLEGLAAAEVELEWRAQVGRFVAAIGRPPTHLDSHHHCSYLNATLFGLMLELAAEIGCGIRLPFASDWSMLGMPAELAAPMADVGSALLEQFNPRRPDAFHAGFFGRSATKAELLRILGGLPAGTSELMCHPGRVDSALLEGSSYARPRQRELEILTDPEVRASVDALGLRLISFAEM